MLKAQFTRCASSLSSLAAAATAPKMPTTPVSTKARGNGTGNY
jgi:hypothetical protein